MPKQESVLEKLSYGFTKFLLSALFGLFISWIILDVGLDLVSLHEPLGGVWIFLIWFSPLIWGFLGLFWFDKMLKIAKEAFESYLHRG